MKPGAGNVGVPTSRNTPLAKSSRFALKIFNKLFVTKRFKPGLLRRAERLSPEAPSHPPPAAGRAPTRNGEHRCQRRGGGGTRTLPRPRPHPVVSGAGPRLRRPLRQRAGQQNGPYFQIAVPGSPQGWRRHGGPRGGPAGRAVRAAGWGAAMGGRRPSAPRGGDRASLSVSGRGAGRVSGPRFSPQPRTPDAGRGQPGRPLPAARAGHRPRAPTRKAGHLEYEVALCARVLFCAP